MGRWYLLFHFLPTGGVCVDGRRREYELSRWRKKLYSYSTGDFMTIDKKDLPLGKSTA